MLIAEPSPPAAASQTAAAPAPKPAAKSTPAPVPKPAAKAAPTAAPKPAAKPASQAAAQPVVLQPLSRKAARRGGRLPKVAWIAIGGVAMTLLVVVGVFVIPWGGDSTPTNTGLQAAGGQNAGQTPPSPPVGDSKTPPAKAPVTSSPKAAAAPKPPAGPSAWTAAADPGEAVTLPAKIDQRVALPGKPLGEVLDFDQIAFTPQPSVFLLATQRSDNMKDRAAVIWNMATGKEVGRMMIAAKVTSLALRSDGKILAGAISDAKPCVIAFWDTATGDMICVVPTRSTDSTTSLRPLGFNAQGQLVAESQYQLHVFDLQQKAEVAVEKTPEVRGLGVYAAISPGGRFVVRTQPSSMSLYDAATLKRLGGITKIPGEMKGVAFSQDGSQVAVGTYADLTVSLHAYDLATGSPVAEGVGKIGGRTAENVARATSDGGWCFDGTLFDAGGKHLATFPADAYPENGTVLRLAGPLSNQQWLVARGEYARGFTILSSPVGEPVMPIVEPAPDKTFTWTDPDEPKAAGGYSIVKCAAGDLMIVGYFNALRIVDMNTGQVRGGYKVFDQSCELSADGTKLAFCTAQDQITVVRLPEMQEISHFKRKGYGSIWLSPSGDTLASLMRNRGDDGLDLFDTSTGKLRTTIKISRMGEVRNGAFLNENTLVLPNESTGGLLLVDVSKGQAKDLKANGLTVQGYTALHTSAEKYILIGGTDWIAADTGEPVGHVRAGSQFVSLSASNWILSHAFENLYLIDSANPRPLRIMALPDGNPSIPVLTPDGKRMLLVGRKDKSVKVWNIQSILDAKPVFPVKP